MARLFVSAGEPSGDRHLSRVLKELRQAGDLDIRGLGGPLSQEQGLSALTDFERLSVLGFAEVIKQIPYFLSLERRCRDVLDSWKPAAVLLVDYPGFNQRLGRAAKARGIPVLYYIAPQVWAWKKDRRPGLAKCLDHLLTVFPFEQALFEEAGIRTTFVGHPLLEAEANGSAPPFSGNSDHRLALLPGSRRQEVAEHLPVMVEAVRRLADLNPEVWISRNPELPRELYRAAEEAGIPSWSGPVPSLVGGASAAVVASGTATLEAGLTGTPMAVVYRTGWLNWQLAKRVVSLRTVGLVNIAAGGDRIPELLQGDFEPETLARVMRSLLLDETERQEQRAYLAGLRERLGTPGAAGRVASAVRAVLASA